MNENVYTIDDLDKNLKKARRREWFQNKVTDFKCWFYNNKEIILFATPIALSVVTKGTQMLHKHVVLKKQNDLKNLYCYDRSLGHYWKLRRELSNDEWIEIDRRKKNGERLADILDELKVLK